MKKWVLALLLFVLTSSLVACRQTSSNYDIYASIYPIEYLAKRIAGEHLSVGASYPRGADVHEYEPPANQIVKMSRSKVLFYIGAGLEGFLVEAKKSTFEKSGCELVELSTFVPLVSFEELGGDIEHHHIADPHIWLDPLRMKTLAEVIRDKIMLIDPEHSDDYLANATDLIKDLDDLHARYIELLNNPIYTEKTILVDHDAYVYWEERYDITRIHTRIENHSCEIIPSEFSRNLSLIAEKNIKYIIVTKNESACPVVNQYVSQANLSVEYLHSLATISRAEEESGLDYLEIMYTNLSILTRVLPKALS